MAGLVTVPYTSRRRASILAIVVLLTFMSGGCIRKSDLDVTGSLGRGAAEPTSEAEWRSYAQHWGQRYEADSADKTAALSYARALRALDQRPQALAVLQQAAIGAPKDKDVLGAYGRALSDAGRLREAAEVLAGAHTPERPDWRILSAQGAVADQLGDPARAQAYYEAALKIVPGEPSVTSNLGLSYALSHRLPEAERLLREAVDHPRADPRVRQNLALVLGLQGKFGDAEGVLKRDMSAIDAAENVASLKRSVAQTNSWKAIRGLDQKPRGAARAEPAAPVDRAEIASEADPSPES